jgi:hypothetical protein
MSLKPLRKIRSKLAGAFRPKSIILPAAFAGATVVQAGASDAIGGRSQELQNSTSEFGIGGLRVLVSISGDKGSIQTLLFVASIRNNLSLRFGENSATPEF